MLFSTRSRMRRGRAASVDNLDPVLLLVRAAVPHFSFQRSKLGRRGNIENRKKRVHYQMAQGDQETRSLRLEGRGVNDRVAEFIVPQQ